MISRASVAFKATPGTQREKGRRFGEGQPTISKWENGGKQPHREQKEQIAKELGIPVEWWDLPPLEAAQPMATAEGRTAEAACDGSPDGTRELAQRLQRQAWGLADRLDHFEGTLPEQIGAAAKLASLIADVGKLTGAAIVNERQILASPSMRRIVDTLTTALTPWPDALQAVTNALESLTQDNAT
jgi:transcriptional regulator with XRE-family HTH domain